ncbi:MAG: glycosyltransferase family 39 protein [Sphingomonas sp.]|uniref:glycosyltransferase family 39 protein n=1 Tax=Sphingomonas sp. TaxID=28214 RepID=UPI001B2998BB|nr:glycosyltransferase family 39 protein [Sphingomonas sp.]MBO9622079.1 glycosyltransferase family 39 protein [Sphingomonas sp.]
MPRLRRADLLLVPILLLAAALRIATCDYSLWFDEIASVAFAHQPVGRLWSAWMVRESNPPLYYTMLGGWIRLFGASDVAVRLLSVATGLVGIVAAWWLARRIGGVRAGLFAAALLAVSAAHLDYSQEARAAMLTQAAALFGCVAMTAYLERPRLGPLLGYAAAATVTLYAHTTMALFVVLANLAMLWLLRRDRRALAWWLATNLAVALLWSWWAWISLEQIRTGGGGFAWIDRPSLGRGLLTTATVYLPLYTVGENLLVAPLLALVWIGGIAWLGLRDRRPAMGLLATLAAGAPPLLWLVSQWVPMLLERTLFWAAGPMIVLLAVALAGIKVRRVGLALLGLLLAVETAALLHWLPERESEAWPQALAEAARIDPGGVLLVESDAMGVAAERYLPGTGLRLVVLDLPGDGFDRWAQGLSRAPHVDRAGAQTLLARRGRLLILKRSVHDPAVALYRRYTEQVFPDPRGRPPTVALLRQPS